MSKAAHLACQRSGLQTRGRGCKLLRPAGKCRSVELPRPPQLHGKSKRVSTAQQWRIKRCGCSKTYPRARTMKHTPGPRTTCADRNTAMPSPAHKPMEHTWAAHDLCGAEHNDADHHQQAPHAHGGHGCRQGGDRETLLAASALSRGTQKHEARAVAAADPVSLHGSPRLPNGCHTHPSPRPSTRL